MNPDEARQEGFETIGNARALVTDVEVCAADIQDKELDDLIAAWRLATIKVGDRLTAIKYERARELREA